jgi:two-component sensor histidine kinase/PAS domain-containing protein
MRSTQRLRLVTLLAVGGYSLALALLLAVRPALLAAAIAGGALGLVAVLLVAQAGWAAGQQGERRRREEELRAELLASRETEARLRAQLQQFDHIKANLPGLIYRVVLGADGQISFPSLERADMLGNLAGAPHPQTVHWLDRIHPDDRAAFYEVLHRSALELAPFDLEQRVGGEPGEQVWVRNITWPVRLLDGSTIWDGVVLDITTQKQVEQNLQRSLREKEVLLQEIHHRVKNNLQVIASLLDLQALTMTDPQTQAALAESQQRVQAMALVHQQLYHASDLARVDFAAYVQSLTDYLLQLNHDSAGRVQIVLDIGEVLLDADTAIPCALIINELVANALKHAFPDERRGLVTISCHAAAQGDSQIVLEIRDDGVGIAPQAASTRGTLGVNLVGTLVRQLHGTLAIESGEPGASGGTRVRVRFTPRSARS